MSFFYAASRQPYGIKLELAYAVDTNCHKINKLGETTHSLKNLEKAPQVLQTGSTTVTTVVLKVESIIAVSQLGYTFASGNA